MKAMRAMVVSAGALIAAASGWAQTVQFYIIDKQADYVQTSSSAPSLSYYRLAAEINGSNLSGMTNHSVSTPGPGTVTMAYDPMDGKWFDHQDFATKALLDAAFPNGTYTYTAVSTASNVPLKVDATPSGDLYPTAVPQITSVDNGATWSGGSLIMQTTGTTTITLNSFAQYSSALNGQVGGHIGVSFYQTSGTGSFVTLQQEAITFQSQSAFNTFMVSGLTAGNHYQFEIEYNVITAADATSLAGATGVGLFTNRLHIDVIAVPEPSTYAAIFGAVALVGVMLHRRRRVA